MIWKVWCGSLSEPPRLVEADTFDEAIDAARRQFPGACAAQPYDERIDGPADEFDRVDPV